MPNSRILYLELIKHDFRSFLKSNPGYYRRLGDGKICFDPKTAEEPPWIYVKPSGWQNCNLWHRVIFDQFHGQNKVPIPCQQCWKVVAMPRNFEELMAIWIMQRQINHPCKCGTEGDRANTNRLYGAYWYNHSIEEGMSTLAKVENAMDSCRVWRTSFLGVDLKAEFGNKHLPMHLHGTTPHVILKRGCTEFEQHCGPSDKWTWDAEQEELEKNIMAAFSTEVYAPRPSDNHIASILAGFIHKAYQWGDESYQGFTNGNRLFVAPVTYHDKDESFLKKFLKESKDG